MLTDLATHQHLDHVFFLRCSLFCIDPQFNPNHRDLNVSSAWRLGFTGKGVVVSILDDGIEKTHPDLLQNYVSA